MWIECPQTGIGSEKMMFLLAGLPHRTFKQDFFFFLAQKEVFMHVCMCVCAHMHAHVSKMSLVKDCVWRH